MFKTETHLHTLPVSTCSRIQPEEMVQLYHKAGYDTIITSDHFSGGHFGELGDELTFRDKVMLLYSSHLRAKL